ncbi:MAG: hypothetical protein OEZ68_11465 [Gammaproteobacteria bacterium]|nr:hypothetical protein [Gammaproteobacteria bacterium]MDH5801411.1 hypothetical protein [Gammaproteobacteria bacterium]
MKDKLIDALNYPRDYVKSGMNLRHCDHGGHYNKDDKDCAMCDTVEECLWLSRNDDCISIEQKPEHILLKSLMFPLDYIDLHLARAGHNVGLCSCEACAWLRNTEELVNEYQRRTHSVSRF